MSECCCGEGSRAEIGCECAIILMSVLQRERSPAYRLSKHAALRLGTNPANLFCPSGCRGSYDHAARDRRQLPATRSADSPPFGKTGALPTGMITGGPRIP